MRELARLMWPRVPGCRAGRVDAAEWREALSRPIVPAAIAAWASGLLGVARFPAVGLAAYAAMVAAGYLFYRNQGPGSVLLVEDESATRRLLARFFAESGWRVSEAADAAEAAAALAARPPPEWAVVDLFLPDRPGSDVIRLIRSLRPPPRVVVWTAAPEGGPAWREAESLGADAVLAKGLTGIGDLLRLVEARS